MSFELTDTKTRMALLSQEQTAQTERLDELQLALAGFRWEFISLLERIDRIEARLDRMEQHIARFEAAPYTGSIQGLDGTVTVSCPPEWGGSVPLVEIEGVS